LDTSSYVKYALDSIQNNIDIMNQAQSKIFSKWLKSMFVV